MQYKKALKQQRLYDFTNGRYGQNELTLPYGKLSFKG